MDYSILPLLFLLYILYSNIWKRKSPGAVPLAGDDGLRAKIKFISDAKTWLHDGVLQYKGKMFRLWTPDGYLHIASPEQFQELNKLGDDRLRVAFTDVLMCQYTKVAMSSMGLRALKEGLAQNFGKLIPKVIDEAIHSLRKELPRSEDWTPVNVYEVTTRVMAIIGGSVFTGPELGTTPEWVDLILSYSSDVIQCAIWLKLVPASLRTTVVHFLPPMRRIKQNYKTVSKMILPVLAAREKASKEPGYITPIDLMQWVADRVVAEQSSYDLNHQAELHLSTGLASIWSSSKTCTHALYDLACYTEYIEPLREEIEGIVAEDGGNITKQGLAKMEKLDSFMKESQRHNVASFSTWDRQTLKPITLKDGTHIPERTYLAVPVSDIDADPTLAHHPEKFDGFRFYNFRHQTPENADRYQFTSTEHHALHFGYGRHAFPGRFLASTEIKAMLAWILMNYDFRMQSGRMQRPSNWTYGLHMVPNSKMLLEFRERSCFTLRSQ